jgi:hypothetical protein
MSKNYFLKLETGHYNMTPFGFHKYANDYFIAADLWVKNISKSDYSPVSYFLFCRSIELGLKAFLLAKNVDIKLVVKNSHNLVESLKMAMTHKLSNHVPTSKLDEDNITLANDIYSDKGFEYFFVINHLQGFDKFPDINLLKDFADKLLKNIKILTDITD